MKKNCQAVSDLKLGLDGYYAEVLYLIQKVENR